MVTAFLSYRHESEEHRLKVRDLAERLKAGGINVVLDQYVKESGGPDDSWPQWSIRQAQNRMHKVLIVGSPGWFRCFDGNEAAGVGLGAAAEARVIFQRFYDLAGTVPDIRMISFEKLDYSLVPMYLKGVHCFADPGDMTDLLCWLKGPAAVSVIPVEGWPESPPALTWPVADHSQARAAFGQFVTRGSSTRLLPIIGGSETGKSLLTKQILNNAMHMPGLSSGRLDFKGTTDMGAAVNVFVQTLGLDPPPDNLNLRGKLTAIMKALADRAAPTLLVFDTFELAGDAENWLKESLLPRLIHADWLRVVIAGQSVPKCHGEVGGHLCATPVQLAPPGPDDWFAYGRDHKPDLTLEFVQRAHGYCQGRGSLLAQLLGPTT